MRRATRSTDSVEAIVGPARRHIADVLARYTPEQQDLLFDYLARAAPAYREARRRSGRRPPTARAVNRLGVR
jgi:hypothetical protein